ncbi:MAG TPA: leucyl aminopeptidase [Patescibacteria group bacterium]|nr:leucyl aminopeptidase [Patescibacteria group bacterium]
MDIKLIQSNLLTVEADAVALFFYEDEAQRNEQLQSVIKHIPALEAAASSEDFKGKKNSVMVLYSADAAKAKRIFLVGLGKKESLKIEQLRRSAAAATKRAASMQLKSIAIYLPSFENFSNEEVAQAITEGSRLSQYKFDKYITTSETKSLSIEQIILWSDDKAVVKEAKKGVEFAKNLADGVQIARDLANAPNCEIYPETLAERVKAAGKEAGFDVEILDKKQITKLKMGGLLGVNQGSTRPPVMIIMKYNGGKKGDAPFGLVGKGVTFDTGGYSIKPAAGMGEMRMDMHGAATVIGTMVSIAKNKLPLNVVAIIPATENLISGNAIVPGDVITFMNGKTAEIDNTDAEGRLILADALTYMDTFKPQAVIDLATLTGACVIALGHTTSGMLGTGEEVKAALKESAMRTNEYVCELPIYEEYEELIKSDYADIKNSGGRAAGTITAALFLKHFIGDWPWVHLDIAGTSIAPKETDYMPKGGTGVGVRLLTDVLKNWKK